MKSRIQIIDDNVALTTLLAKALSKFGYDPVVENNPLLAVNTVRHYMPDLILLDVMMPERDGGRVLADLRNDLSLRYIPVILLTAIAREAQALALMCGIRSTVISKPVQLRDLVSTIESHLNANLTYNQLKENRSSAAPTQSTGPTMELPNFDVDLSPAEVNLHRLSLGSNEERGQPSTAFGERSPTRVASFPQEEPAQSFGFAFPGREEEERPAKPVW